MSEILRIDQDMVAGKLLRIWAWADQNSVEGSVSVSAAFLDRLTAKKGFAAAMRTVGWLTGEDGNLGFANFERHNGDSAKARAESARRMTKTRDSRNATTALGCGNVALLVQHKVQPDKIREDKIREDDIKPPIRESGNGQPMAPTEPQTPEPTPRIGYPTALADSRFIAVFEGEWLPYLANRNQRLPSNITVDKQLAQLASHGDLNTAIDCVQEAMRLGFNAPLKTRPNGTRHEAAPRKPEAVININDIAV